MGILLTASLSAKSNYIITPASGLIPDSRLRDCVAIAACHCETPLRRCGNLIYSMAYEIASLIIFARKGCNGKKCVLEEHINYIKSYI